MNEENNNVNNEAAENAAEAVNETAENAVDAVNEAAENAAEAVNEAAENAAEAVSETAEEAQEAVQEVKPDTAEEGIFVFDPSDAAANTSAGAKKPVPKALIAAGAAVVVVAAIVIVLAANWSTWFNKYNRMGYVDVSGRTIAEVADASGKELKDFLEEFGLPADMPANTTESAAYYMIPVSKIAASYGMDFATLKEVLQWDDSITEDTTWGDAEGETKLGVYVGEEGLEEFKERYDLDESVNADTKWKEVRTAVDIKNKEANEAAKNAVEDTDTTAEEDAESAEDTEAETESAEESAQN